MLRTERLSLRRVEEDDWRAIQGIWENQKHAWYAQYDKPNCTDDEAVRQRIARWSRFSAGTEHMYFAVCLEGTVIGYAAFNQRDAGYELGYCFHSDWHGKGYARESLSALIDEISGGETVRFEAGTALNNVPSVRLLTGLGFKKIGEERVSFYRDENGEDIFFDGGVFELVREKQKSEK